MSAAELDFRNENTLWASVLVETLARCGVTQAVVSPGSRSTPLTVALAQHLQIEAIPVLDERSAAFFALGLAKKSHQAVALICTSGTAGANYHPAVIEAQESGVSLLVITADRPPELRSCASGQTIDQQKLFGGHVNYFHELAVPEASLSLLGYMRQIVAHAVERTAQPQAGPVHLNTPFRDPLAPLENQNAKGLQGKIPTDFFEHLQPFEAIGFSQTKIWQRATTSRGLIVAGPEATDDPSGYAEIVGTLAEQLGWPVLADGVSPLRHHPAGKATIITSYDTLLRNEGVARDLIPRYVLCLGSWPTSKVLRGWLEQSGAEMVLVTDRADNRDCLHGRTRHMRVPVKALLAKFRKEPIHSYEEAWERAETKTQENLRSLARADGLFEGDIVPALAEALPHDTSVFVASSMAIRDVEYFWPANHRGIFMYFNRGANGIDGTLSTAVGIAHGSKAAVLLTGDLAFLHDVNGLLLKQRLNGSLTIVLINNEGGGIFEHLPVAQFEPPFEDYFATPQSVDFKKLCMAHGIEHVAVDDLAQLRGLVALLPESGIRILEVRTDRKQDAAFRKRLFKHAAAQLG